MGLSCCVPGCNHKNGRELCSLYNFPNENDGPDWKQWYELWCERIGKSQREGGANAWTPTTWSRVCSCHFKEEERWKPRTRQPGLKFRAPVYFPFMSGASGSRTKSEPMNKTPLLAGLRVDTGMKSSLLAGLNVKILNPDKTSSESLKGENLETDSAASNGQKSEDNSTEEGRKEDAKRERQGSSESSAKKSKTEEDDDVEMIEDDDDNGCDEIKKGIAAKTTGKSQENDVQMIDVDEKSKAKEKSFAEVQRALLMKAVSKCQ